MPFTADDVRANRDYFAEKLRSEKPRNDVVKAAEGTTPYDFVLLDTRGHEAFAGGHIPGAWSVDLDQLEQVASRLPKDREIVTYCWGHD